MASPERTHEAARVGILSRHRGPEHPDVAEARRALRAAQIDEHIKRLVDEAPPLTPEQRDQLAALLRSVSDAGDGGGPSAP